MLFGKKIFLVDNAHTKSQYFNRSTTWYYNQSTLARYVNQSTQMVHQWTYYTRGLKLQRVALKLILILLIMPWKFQECILFKMFLIYLPFVIDQNFVSPMLIIPCV